VSDGLVDTNVFIHALTHDAQSEECLRFLDAVRRGEVRMRLESIVLHELSYAIRHYRKELSRADIAEYLLAVLGWQGVQGDRGILIDTVQRWRDSPNVAFVDCYLAAVAFATACPIYSKNVKELSEQGANVPALLPAAAEG
jgi:predicted nucleic acid-binding protein